MPDADRGAAAHASMWEARRGVVGAAVAVFALLTVAVVRGMTSGFDNWLLRGLHHIIDRGDADGPVLGFFNVVARLGGDQSLALLVAACSLWLLWHGDRLAAAIIPIVFAGGIALDELFKTMVGRPRPAIHDPELTSLLGPSFPSGHAVSAICGLLVPLLLVALSVTSRRVRITLLAVALTGVALVDISRVVLAAHWPTDVVAGNALGIAWSYVVIAGTTRMLRARRRRPGQELGR